MGYAFDVRFNGSDETTNPAIYMQQILFSLFFYLIRTFFVMLSK